MHLYLDCRAGISGDMTLAALCHLGLRLEPLQALLHDAGVACHITTWQECRAAGPGQRVDVTWSTPQPLRHPQDMADIIARAQVSENVRQHALAALNALAAAETHAHNISVEDVHFHEVGGIDTLVDILGMAWGLEQMHINTVTASPLPWFSGTITCEHGVLPLPAPATAYLMQHKPIFSTNATTELITPTGAALVHSFVTAFTDGPTGTLVQLGTGYGSRPSTSGLRAWLLKNADTAPELPRQETITLLESHIDHLTGEELGAALTALQAASEVLDVLWLPGTGKKNRPSGSLRVICHPQHMQLVTNIFFKHTHTLGLRCQHIERYILPRTACMQESPHGPLAAKGYTVDAKKYVRLESDARAACAARQGIGMPAVC